MALTRESQNPLRRGFLLISSRSPEAIRSLVLRDDDQSFSKASKLSRFSKLVARLLISLHSSASFRSLSAHFPSVFHCAHSWGDRGFGICCYSLPSENGLPNLIGHFVLNVAGVDHCGGESAEIDKALVSRPVNVAAGIFVPAGRQDVAKKNAVPLLSSGFPLLPCLLLRRRGWFGSLTSQPLRPQTLAIFVECLGCVRVLNHCRFCVGVSKYFASVTYFFRNGLTWFALPGRLHFICFPSSISAR